MNFRVLDRYFAWNLNKNIEYRKPWCYDLPGGQENAQGEKYQITSKAWRSLSTGRPWEALQECGSWACRARWGSGACEGAQGSLRVPEAISVWSFTSVPKKACENIPQGWWLSTYLTERLLSLQIILLFVLELFL